jgi:hypothetical protein
MGAATAMINADDNITDNDESGDPEYMCKRSILATARAAQDAKKAADEKLYFRVDGRKFKPGDQIRTAGHFMSMHHQVSKAVERALILARPAGKPPREDCLMLFEDQICAWEFRAMRDADLYLVSITPGSILHRGDMNLLGEMAGMVRQGRGIFREAQRYWNGEPTKDSPVEVLVRAGTIVERLEVNLGMEEEWQRLIREDREAEERWEREFLQTICRQWDPWEPDDWE